MSRGTACRAPTAGLAVPFLGLWGTRRPEPQQHSRGRGAAACLTEALQEQHGVPEAVEPVALLHGLGVRLQDELPAGEGGDEHQQRRTR